jgi:hypothetical protein
MSSAQVLSAGNTRCCYPCNTPQAPPQPAAHGQLAACAPDGRLSRCKHHNLGMGESTLEDKASTPVMQLLHHTHTHLGTPESPPQQHWQTGRSTQQLPAMYAFAPAVQGSEEQQAHHSIISQASRSSLTQADYHPWQALKMRTPTSERLLQRAVTSLDSSFITSSPRLAITLCMVVSVMAPLRQATCSTLYANNYASSEQHSS